MERHTKHLHSFSRNSDESEDDVGYTLSRKKTWNSLAEELPRESKSTIALLGKVPSTRHSSREGGQSPVQLMTGKKELKRIMQT